MSRPLDKEIELWYNVIHVYWYYIARREEAETAPGKRRVPEAENEVLGTGG